MSEALLAADPAAEYLRTYREWRDLYGLGDPCIEELKAAISLDSERDSHTIPQRDRLEMLVLLIEREQARHWEFAA